MVNVGRLCEAMVLGSAAVAGVCRNLRNLQKYEDMRIKLDDIA